MYSKKKKKNCSLTYQGWPSDGSWYKMYEVKPSATIVYEKIVG